MIKPASLWGLFKTCESSEWLGTVCRALGGQEVTLDFGQQQAVRMISLDSGWLDEAVEAKREKWRERQKAHRAKDGAAQDAEGGASVTSHNVTPVTHEGVTAQCHDLPSVLPSVRPSVHPSSQTNTIRSDIEPKGAVDFGSGLKVEIEKFKKAVQSDQTGGGVFFDPAYDPVVMACALTKERDTARVWRKAMDRVGDGRMREELFAFYRELLAGEEPDNRGAALNARLKRMEGGAQ